MFRLMLVEGELEGLTTNSPSRGKNCLTCYQVTPV